MYIVHSDVIEEMVSAFGDYHSSNRWFKAVGQGNESNPTSSHGPSPPVLQ